MHYILTPEATSGHQAAHLHTYPYPKLCHVAAPWLAEAERLAIFSCMLLLAAVVLQMSFTELPLPVSARVPDGAFKCSSSRDRRSLLMRSRLDTPLKEQVLEFQAVADIVEHELFSSDGILCCVEQLLDAVRILLDGERGHEEFVHVGLCHAWVQVPRRRHHTALLGQQ